VSRRKGEVTLPEIKRKWPHRVALSADKLRGVESVVHRFANGRSAPRPYSLRRDDGEFVVFCFARPEDADAFASGSVGNARQRCGDDGCALIGQQVVRNSPLLFP
jgi:hypothetical protein